MSLEELKRDVEYNIMRWQNFLKEWKRNKNAQKETPHFNIKAETIINANQSFLIKLQVYENYKKTDVVV